MSQSEKAKQYEMRLRAAHTLLCNVFDDTDAPDTHRLFAAAVILITDSLDDIQSAIPREPFVVER